jgi:xanthosine utilization system XapX-like protein
MADYLVAAVAGLGVGVISVLALRDTQWPQFATMAFPLVAAGSATTIQNIMTRFSRT